MEYLKAFMVCGIISLLGQLIYDNSKFTPGHITSLFVVLGCILDSFDFYDQLLKFSKIGASLPITSFGHLLAHASIDKAAKTNILGIFTGIFDNTGAGIGFSIFMAFIVAIIFRPKS